MTRAICEEARELHACAACPLAQPDRSPARLIEWLLRSDWFLQFHKADPTLMRRIDELHLNFPFAGARMLRDMLKLEGLAVGPKRAGGIQQRGLPLHR